MLMQNGVQTGSCNELLNITRPQAVGAIHAAYREAGSDAVETNSLGGNAIALKKHGLDEQTEALSRAAAQNARAAVGPDTLVALSVGPTGGFLKPIGSLGVREVFEAYRRQIMAAEAADIVYIETMGDLAEARLAAIAALENTDKPVAASFTFQNGRLMTGATPETVAAVMQAAGVHALGVNCSGGPDELLDALVRMRSASSLPVIVQPNAGLPVVENGVTRFPLSPEDMAPKMKAILDAGAAAIGGCCGTTPAHIRLMKALLDGRPGYAPGPWTPCAATGRRVFPLDTLERRFVPAETDLDSVYDLDPDEGIPAFCLDALDETQIEEFVLEVQQIYGHPVSFRARDEGKLRFALLCYCGVAFTPGKAWYGAVKE